MKAFGTCLTLLTTVAPLIAEEPPAMEQRVPLLSNLTVKQPSCVDALHPDMPFASGSLKAGQVATYTFPLAAPSNRHTITLHSATGNADLAVSLGGASWQSAQGPLMTDRVSLTPAQIAKGKDLSLRVEARSDCQFILMVTQTDFHIAVTAPPPGGALQVTVEEQFGDADNLLANVTIANGSSAWYEERISAPKEALARMHLREVSMLGPKQSRLFPWAACKPTDKITVAIDRSSRSALIYTTCDIAARLVSGGRGLSNTLPDDLLELVPKLQPLAEVGSFFARGDAARGAAKLFQVIRTDPQTLTALQQFLSRSGIRISSSVLSGKILSGYGPVSAIVQGLATVKSPKRETIVLRAMPNAEAQK